MAVGNPGAGQKESEVTYAFKKLSTSLAVGIDPPYLCNTVLIYNDCFTEGKGFVPLAASAASIVAAKGCSFQLTRSAFTLPLMARRLPLETFGTVLLVRCFIAAQYQRLPQICSVIALAYSQSLGLSSCSHLWYCIREVGPDRLNAANT